MQYDLERAALFEAEVSNNDGSFDATRIERAWEPVYLTPDGNAPLEESGVSVASAKAFRVAFYVQEWQEGQTLAGPNGPLVLPKFMRVPERLWHLAPYAIAD